MKPVIIRMVVDLPAPFGPRKPSTSPRSTANETPSTARLGPKAFTRLSILITATAYNGISETDRIDASGVSRPGQNFTHIVPESRRFSHNEEEQNHAIETTVR